MKRQRLEALADAVASVSGYSIPGSPLYMARNPGGLKAYGKASDEAGNRVFGSVVDGLQALIFDTAFKLEGLGRAHLQPSDTLQEFALSHGQPITAAEAYVKFLRRALHDPTINKNLTISYFLED